ncbi:hypothetical protein AB1Y20_019196 [Prymnesium parvum]|uniref:Uncharacterized protein n=1 Tax=Prymnesium parvum TaxID=97485 RepID=A0AB34JTB9_PRYPA
MVTRGQATNPREERARRRSLKAYHLQATKRLKKEVNAAPPTRHLSCKEQEKRKPCSFLREVDMNVQSLHQMPPPSISGPAGRTVKHGFAPPMTPAAVGLAIANKPMPQRSCGAGCEPMRSKQPFSVASAINSTISARSANFPTPRTPGPGMNLYGFAPGDPCWYIGVGNAQTKAEIILADGAPIIGLEDLSLGLRSLHTQWNRLVPMIQSGDLCWKLDSIGSTERKLVVLRQAATGAQVASADDAAAPTNRCPWSLLEPLREEEANRIARLSSQQRSMLCDGKSLQDVLALRPQAHQGNRQRRNFIELGQVREQRTCKRRSELELLIQSK